MAKVLCVLYEDPVEGYPRSYARDAIPRIERYFDGQTTPTPERVDFEPGELLGSVSGELGLRRFLEERGHAFVVTSDKDGPDSLFERELLDAEILSAKPQANNKSETNSKSGPNTKSTTNSKAGTTHKSGKPRSADRPSTVPAGHQIQITRPQANLVPSR